MLDRFHVMQQFSKAIDPDPPGRGEAVGARGLRADPAKVAVVPPETSREHDRQTNREAVGTVEVQPTNRASLSLAGGFPTILGVHGATWAGKFLDEWTGQVMRSRLEPLKKVARTLRKHRPLILNWFRARGEVSAGAVEGLNNKVKLVTRKSYGFQTAEVAKLALLHNLGRLPEPERTHRFC